MSEINYEARKYRNDIDITQWTKLQKPCEERKWNVWVVMIKVCSKQNNKSARKINTTKTLRSKATIQLHIDQAQFEFTNCVACVCVQWMIGGMGWERGEREPTNKQTRAVERTFQFIADCFSCRLQNPSQPPFQFQPHPGTFDNSACVRSDSDDGIDVKKCYRLLVADVGKTVL